MEKASLRRGLFYCQGLMENAVHFRRALRHLPAESSNALGGDMRKPVSRFAILTTALVLAGAGACAPLDNGIYGAVDSGAIEQVYAAVVTDDVAAIRVASNGCTDKDDIQPRISRGAGRAVLTLVRTHQDTCTQPSDEGVLVQWTFNELGLPSGSQLLVANPLRVREDAVIGGQR